MEKLVQPLEQVHVNLLKKQPWYVSWHQNKLNQPAHWIIFLAIGIFLTSIVTSRILGLNNLSSSAAEVSSVSGIVGPSATCDYYASPTGTSGGDGSSGNPWDLHTALSKTAEITAGKTLCLKGGTYIGRYASNLAGTANSPVIIRSAPGEWAKIDGNYSTTLTADFGINDTVVQVSDVSGLPSANEVFGFIIDNEILRIYGRTGNTLTVYDRRAVGAPNGPANHSAGAAGLVSTPIFAINGAYTLVRDFEITNSDPDRINLDAERGAGINTVVVGTKIINMVIHDVGHPGIGFWENVGDGGEIYGSLIWGNGEYDNGGTWTRGSGVYAQNRLGTRYIKDNIWFRNFTSGISIFTTNGYADGFDVEGNISFDHQGSQNFWAGSQNINPIQRLKMISNYGYHRGPYSVDPNSDFGIGYTTYNKDAEIRDNFMVSNNATFGPKYFENLLITGNSIYLRPGQAQALIGLEQDNKVSYTIDNNHYYGDERFTISPCPGGCSILGFDQWKSAGYDTNGTYSSSAPPDSYAVRPNAYQAGRANIVVYNWSNQNNVFVDVSNVLTSGDTYEVYDAQNIFGGPIATGTYNGGNISIPMTSTTINPVVGSITHVANYTTHTPSEFGAFVLFSVPNGQATVATPSISPNGGSYSSTQSVSISTATSGASIRYTTDGSTPTSSSGTVYSSAFNISSTTTVKAIAYKTGDIDSAVASATFTITTPPSGGGGGGGSSGGGGGGSSGGGNHTPPSNPQTPSLPTTNVVLPANVIAGQVIKFPNNPTIYLVQSTGLHPFDTWDSFLAYQAQSGAQIITRQGTASTYTVSTVMAKTILSQSTTQTPPSAPSTNLPADKSNFKCEGNPTIYFYTNGEKQAYSEASVFEVWNGKSYSSVQTVASSTCQSIAGTGLVRLPEGTLVKASGGSEIYRIENNQARPFTSFTAYQRDSTGKTLYTISLNYLHTYSRGENIY